MTKEGLYQGIWIDKHKAYIFGYNNGKSDFKLLESEIETRNRIEGESKSGGRFGDQYLDTDKKKKSKENEQTAAFLKKVNNEINKKASLVLFGPAEMKVKLSKIMDNSSSVGIENADSMSEKQMAAWVRDYFEL